MIWNLDSEELSANTGFLLLNHVIKHARPINRLLFKDSHKGNQMTFVTEYMHTDFSTVLFTN